MQLESHHIYKGVSDKHNLPVDLVKSLGDCVFQSLSELQRDPPNLILVIRGIGRRFIRKKKVQEKIAKLEISKDFIIAGANRGTVTEVDNELKILRSVMDWYDEFTAERKYVKTLRDEYPTPVEPGLPSGQVPETGAHYSGEHQGLSAGEPAIPAFKDWISTATKPCTGTSLLAPVPGEGEIT